MQYTVIEKKSNEISSKDKHGTGLLICLDPQERLGRNTWIIVSILPNEISLLGLFWKLGVAKRFAEAL